MRVSLSFLANTIEELSLDYHSFQSDYSSSLTKSTLLIDKTYLEDSVKRIEEQCGMYQVQCEKNYETLIKGQEELVGEEKREKQVSFLSRLDEFRKGTLVYRWVRVLYRGKLWN